MSVPVLLQIDTDGDGIYDLDVTADVISAIECSRGKDQIRELSPSAAGRMTFTLNNTSEAYTLLTKGLLVQLSSLGVSGDGLLFEDGEPWLFEDGEGWLLENSPAIILWTGYTDDIVPQVDPRGQIVSITVSCLGPLSRLVGINISTPYLEDRTTAELLHEVCDKAGWPEALRDFDIGLTNVTSFCGDGDAYSIAEKIRMTEGPWATLGESRDGKITFRNRDYRITNPSSTTEQATYADTDVMTQGFQPDRNEKDIIKGVRIQTVERELQPIDKVWDYGQELVIEANATARVKVRGLSEPFSNAQIPSATGTNAEQLIRAVDLAGAAVELTSGSGVLEWNGQQTGSIAYNATASDCQTELEGLSNIGAGNVLCYGGPLNVAAIGVLFRGTLKETVQPLITFVSGNFNATNIPASVTIRQTKELDVGVDQEFTAFPSVNPLTGGSFKFKFSSLSTTGTILHTASAANIQTALENTSLFDPSDVSVSGGPITSADVVITIHDSLFGAPVPLPVIVSSTLIASQPNAKLVISEVAKGTGPDFVITAGAIVGIEFANDVNSGLRVDMLIEADSGGATLAGLQMRGQTAKVIRNQEATYPEDLSTIEDTTPGAIYPPDILQEIALPDAQSFARMIVEHYANPLPHADQLNELGMYDPATYGQFIHEQGDRVRLINAQEQVNHPYFVERIIQRFEGIRSYTTLQCERAA